MKKVFLALTAVLCLTVGHAQTNVSGGIYANATWTLANSPYIVVDTIVVFPNVTLTIQPGVTVKFDNNKRMEIRQAKLIAIGTATDSITFTSNSSSPTSGIWSDIFFNQSNLSKFNYCNFFYADKAVYPSYMYDTITIKNSNFRYNNIGLGWVYYSDIIVDSCTFRNNINGIKWATGRINMSNSTVIKNQNGILSPEGSTYFRCVIDSNTAIGIATQQWDTLIECEIKYNGIGLDVGNISGTGSHITKNVIENNNLGIQLNVGYDHIFCNKICNNTTYDLKSTINYNTNAVANNYWCTTDSASTEIVIYDGFDNINLGLVFFMPLDTLQCYLGNPTSINENLISSVSLYPNPFSSQTTLHMSAKRAIPQGGTDNLLHNATLTVNNCFGQTVAQINLPAGQAGNSDGFVIHRGNLVPGVYFYQITSTSLFSSPNGGGQVGAGRGEVLIATGKLCVE